MILNYSLQKAGEGFNGLARARSLGRDATFGFAKFFSPIPNRLEWLG
jgi:hypothetical protein